MHQPNAPSLWPRRGLVLLVVAAATLAATGSISARTALARVDDASGVRVGGSVAPRSAMAGVASVSPDDAEAETGRSYRLVDTWRTPNSNLTAGRFRQVADVSSSPDGTVFVLDSLQGAVHVLSSTGEPVRVFEVPPGEAAPKQCQPLRLDTGPDGSVTILGSCGPSSGVGAGASGTGYVLRMYADGGIPDTTVLPRTYSDVAVRPDGTLVLARMGPVARPSPVPDEDEEAQPGGLDVVDHSGNITARIEHESLFYPMSVDVDADGSVYVANRVPSPWDYEEPGPQPTSLPSLLSPAQGSDPIDGVIIFGADGQHRQTVPFVGPEDVAVGPSGAYVARNVEVFRLGDSMPLYSGPPGQLVTSFSDGIVLHLDVTAHGRLLAGMAHCYHQGLLFFDRGESADAEPRPVGSLDLPELRGPTHPARIAVGDNLSLLQDRFLFEDDGIGREYFAGPNPDQPQTVQRWSMGGRLVEQLGVCSGSTSVWLHDNGTALWTSDVASDGAAEYTLDKDILKRRSGAFPEWSLWVGADAPVGTQSHLTAVSADAGHVAVLDVGTGSVVVVRQDGSVSSRWPLGTAGADALSGDIALSGDSVYVADAAQNRVRRYALDGTPTATWTTHDRPWRIDAGPNGGVFVLGRSGWAMHYDSFGALQASWPMPVPAAQPVDLAAGPDGRVFVTFVVSETVHPPGWLESRVVLQDAGIWVFEPTAGTSDPQPEPGACWSAAERSVVPTRLRRGDEVTVTASVAGGCPGAAVPAQVVLVLDTSRSMNWNQAVDSARQLSLAVVAAMDPREVDVALVTFDDEGVLRVPLTKEHGDVAAQIAAVQAWGDTHLAAGLKEAVAELEGERALAGARKAIVIVTDGENTDDALEIAETARAANIDLLAVALPHGGPESYFDALAAVTGDQALVLVDPDAEAASRLARAHVGYQDEHGLYQTVEVADQIPGNMRYVTGSGVPQPRLEGDTLRWSFDRVQGSAGLAISYRLEPLELGHWPTSTGAAAEFVDALGNVGRRTLPVPHVYVWDESLLTEQVHLPFAALGIPSRSGLSVAPHGSSSADLLSLRQSDDETALVYLPAVSRPPATQQFDSDLHAARARYPHINGTRLNHCRLCHVMDERFGMNSYGQDYLGHDRDFEAIEPIDSDHDGFSNLAEIRALTFPGWAGSRPATTK